MIDSRKEGLYQGTTSEGSITLDLSPYEQALYTPQSKGVIRYAIHLTKPQGGGVLALPPLHA